MKVSVKMFGLPGKCVACRQKIRIPRRDEIGEDVIDIYLRDHPEFLRKPGRKSAATVEEESTPTDETPPTPAVAPVARSPKSGRVGAAEQRVVASAKAGRKVISLGESSERVNTVPLDTFEPLRNLCSVRHKMERQLAALNEEGDASGQQRAHLRRRLLDLKRVRVDLDEQLRQVLMEVAIELASTHEKIVQTGLEARVGEVSFDRYRDTIDRLRRRRDRLERRQHNLRGWLATSNPHLAGGYIEVPIDSVPIDGFTVSVPSDPEETDPLLNIHANALRDALHRRAQAGRKLLEIAKMEAGEPKEGRALGEAKADCKAERIIAEATAAFCRDRLLQLQGDCQSDADSAEAQLDLLRGRLQIGEIDRVKYDALERQYVRAKVDAVKARAVAGGAVRARSAQDVPHAKGTFLARLALRPMNSKNGPDQWIAWGASLLLAIGVFLPAMNGLSLVSAFFKFPDNSISARWAFLGPILLGAMVSLAAGLSNGFLRGALISVLWGIATLLGAWMLHQTAFDVDPMSARFRSGSMWALRPGMLLLIAGNLLIAASAVMAVLSSEGPKRWPLAIGTASALGIFLILTDGAGFFAPTLTIRTLAGDFASLPGPGVPLSAQHWTVSARNEGHRAALLVGRNSEARAAYTFLLEKKAGANSWLPVEWPGIRENAYGQIAAVKPGQDVSFELLLPEGEYRVIAQSSQGDAEESTFTVASRPVTSPEIANAPTGAEPGETQVAGATREPPPLDSPGKSQGEGGTYDEVELKGILTDNSGATLFTLAVRTPAGAEQRSTLTIGEDLRPGWTLSQHNPELRTVTLSSADGRILTLRRGEAVALR